MKPDKKKSDEEDKKKKAYVPGSWKMPNDKGQGPGAFNIVRLMTVVAGTGEAKDKGMKRFANIPTLERVKLGIINKVPPAHISHRSTKPSVPPKPLLPSPPLVATSRSPHSLKRPTPRSASP